MDFPSSLKKSFKTHGSYKHTRRISVGGADDDSHHEQLPILHDHDGTRSSSVEAANDHHEVIVKIDDGDRNSEENTANTSSSILRAPSYDFWKDGQSRGSDGFNIDDPPSRLIGQFLNKQKNAGGEMSLDMDLEMDELRHERHSHNPNPDSPVKGMINREIDDNRSSKELRVSFQPPHDSESIDIVSDERGTIQQRSSDEFEEVELQEQQHARRRSGNLNLSRVLDDKVSPDEVVKCTSFQRRTTSKIIRMKTQQSRLMDPPDVPVSGMTGRQDQYRSGMLGRTSGTTARAENEDEDDSLFDEDNPDDFKKTKLDALTIIQWISLILIMTALICTLVIQEMKRKSLRGLHLWEWEVLVLVLICGRLVSGWGIRFVVFFIERNFLLRKRVLYFVYGIRKPVQNCFWLGLVLIAWHYMFDEKVEGHNGFLLVVNKLMVCSLVATSLWLVKTLMVKVLASSFHVSKFFDRIQDALFNQYVIETLSGPPLIEIQNHQEEEEKTMAEVWKLQNAGAKLPPELRANAFPHKSHVSTTDGSVKTLPGVSMKKSGPLNTTIDEEQGITIDQLHRLNPKNVSAWNMKRLMRIVRRGALTTLDEQIHGMGQEDETATQIRSEVEAKRAARKIFFNVARRGSKFIYLDDLMRFLREEEGLKTMALLEGTPGDGKISKAALKNWVVNAFRERKALALTLNDTKTAVNKLHRMVNVLVGIIILIICLLILNIATTKFLVLISSQVVVVAFIFGNTCKTVFEAIIFLFVMHPFDVGDRCEIDGVQMIVEEMNILTTIFLRFDNQKIYFPNSTLATKAISNYYRSPDMGDAIDFTIHIATPADKVNTIKQRIINYIENKKDHWYTAPMVVIMNLEDLNRLKMSVWLRHKMNHQDMGERYMRRDAVIEEMIRIFKELDIEYRMYPLDINIKSMPPPVTSSRVPPSWGPSH